MWVPKGHIRIDERQDEEEIERKSDERIYSLRTDSPQNLPVLIKHTEVYDFTNCIVLMTWDIVLKKEKKRGRSLLTGA